MPEHLNALHTPHVAHPGCFATAILLASVPLLSLGLESPRLFVTGITGSTGSGRQPTAGTHHPQRHSDLYAYNALAHRHTPEVTALARAATGVEAEFNFVPHSGPFARGIHVTVQAVAREPLTSHELRARAARVLRPVGVRARRRRAAARQGRRWPATSRSCPASRTAAPSP